MVREPGLKRAPEDSAACARSGAAQARIASAANPDHRAAIGGQRMRAGAAIAGQQINPLQQA